MATRKESDFNGKRGGLLFYDRQGKHIIHVVPRKGVQTKATQSKAALFGRASSLPKQSEPNWVPWFLSLPTTICKPDWSQLFLNGLNPENGVTSGSRSAELLFNYGKKKITALNFSFSFPITEGSLVIVGATMEYTVLKNHIHQLNRDKRFMPAAIIGVMYV